MILLTKELEKRFEKVGNQENDKNPIVVIKFFNACGAGTWYATEITEYRLSNKEGVIKCTNSYKAKEDALKKGYKLDDVLFFGYASIFGDDCDEWGCFALSELESIKGFAGLGIERDLYCGEKRISEFNISSLRK